MTIKLEGDSRGQLWISYEGKRFAKVTDEYLAKELFEQNSFYVPTDDEDENYNQGWNDCLEDCLDALRDISRR